ncbi:MAG: lactate utilization protein [Clostridiales bacterium]|nr:lactate utilization protein [Clostridiales bacterium]
MSPKEIYKEKLAQKIIKGLNKRNMEGHYAPTKEEVLKTALEIIPQGASISWGGSESIKEVGVLDAVKSGNYIVYDRDSAKSPEERTEIMRKGMFADFYLGSSNAITYDGELVNIDGMGGRVAAYIWGPENVLLFVSLNKAVGTIEEGVNRVRNCAAPPNAERLNLNTPCRATGLCGNCLSADTICSQLVVTRFSKIKNRIKVILIGEESGY